MSPLTIEIPSPPAALTAVSTPAAVHRSCIRRTIDCVAIFYLSNNFTIVVYPRRTRVFSSVSFTCFVKNNDLSLKFRISNIYTSVTPVLKFLFGKVVAARVSYYGQEILPHSNLLYPHLRSQFAKFLYRRIRNDPM